MPFEDKQIETGSDGKQYQYDAGANKWNIFTSDPDKQVVPRQAVTAEPAPPDMANVGGKASLADIGRGVYHGGLDELAGIAGAPADLANAAGIAPSGASAGLQNLTSSNIRNNTFGGLGGHVDQPQSPYGHLAGMGTQMAMDYAMPLKGVPFKNVPSRLWHNVVAPQAGAEAAGQFSDNPSARMAGALLAGGVRGKNFPAEKARLSKIYQDYEEKVRSDSQAAIAKGGGAAAVLPHMDMVSKLNPNQYAPGAMPFEERNKYLQSLLTDPKERAYWKGIDKQNAKANNPPPPGALENLVAAGVGYGAAKFGGVPIDPHLAAIGAGLLGPKLAGGTGSAVNQIAQALKNVDKPGSAVRSGMLTAPYRANSDQ